MAAPQVGGWLLAAGLGVNSNFLVFAVGAAIAGLLLLRTPRPAGSRQAGQVPGLRPETARA